MRTRWQRRALSLFAVYRHVDLENSGRDRRLWRGRLDMFDLFSLGFINVVLVVLVARGDGLTPWMSDTWYHAAIAKQVVVQKAIPAWVDWDYAPVGRPHLYPPLLHLLMAGLAGITGSVISAGQVLAVLFLPASYLACWYAARWIFDSRVAFIAMLVLSLDLGHTIVELAYIPSCFVNILAPILLVTLLTRRTWASITLLTLMFYAHLGIPYLVAFGLVLFGIKYPRYRAEVAKVVGIALIFALPWLFRVWVHREWIAGVTGNLGLPMSVWKRIFSLQLFNGVLVGCGLWGIRGLHKSRSQEAIVRWMLVGMLPLLFSYGGRFTMHSAPLWAIPAATVLVRLLPAVATWRRPAALMAATLLPTPSLVPLTTTHGLILLAVNGRPLMGDGKNKSEAYLEDCDQVAAWLKAHTAPDEIIHVNKEWIGDMIPLIADRRTDFGAWWECSREIAKLRNRLFRDDGRRAVFVCIEREADTGSILGPTQVMPAVDRTIAMGRLIIGVRHQRGFSHRRVLDDFERAGPVAWCPTEPVSSSQVTLGEEPPATPQAPSRRFLTWVIPRGSKEAAAIARPFSPGAATGLAFNARCSAPLGDVTLGVTEADGSKYEWPLALPSVPRALHLDRSAPADDDIVRRQASWVRVRVPFAWMSLRADSEDENETLDADRITSLWLRGPEKLSRDVRIDLDDIALMDVTTEKPADGKPQATP